MTRKKLWKSFAAWLLILGMVFSDSSFAAYAQEAKPQEENTGQEETDVKEIQKETESVREVPEEEEKEVRKDEVVKEQEIIKEKTSAEGSDADKTESTALTGRTPEVAEIPEEQLGDASGLQFECMPAAGEDIDWDVDNLSLRMYEKQSVFVCVKDDSGQEVSPEDVTWKLYQDEAAMAQNQPKEGLLTVEGNKLSFGELATEEDEDYILCASVGESRKSIDLRIWKQGYSYWFGMAEDVDYLFTNQVYYVDDVECTYRNPKIDTEPQYIPVETVSVIEGEDCITYEKRDDGEGGSRWALLGKKAGRATIEFTCKRADGDPAPDRTLTLTRKYEVSDYNSNLEYSYPNGSDQMVKESSMTIGSFVLAYNTWEKEENGDGDYKNEEIKNPELSVVSFDKNMINAAVDGNNLIITSKSQAGETSVTVKGKSGAYECEIEIPICISDSYYLILPAKTDNVGLDEILDLNEIGLRLLYFGEACKEGREITDAEFDIYNISIEEWEVQESSKKLPVLKRISPDDLYISISASLPASEVGPGDGPRVAETQLSFAGFYYYSDDIEYKYTYEGYPAGQGTNILFEGTPLTLEIATKDNAPAFPEGCEITWTVQDGDESSGSSEYVTKTDKRFSTTLKASLPKDDESYHWVNVGVSVTCKGFELYSDSIPIDVCKPSYNSEVSLGDGFSYEVLAGENFAVKPVITCDYRDASAPEGKVTKVPVTNVSIAKEFQWDNNGDEIEVEKGKVAALTKDAENGWILHGKESGKVELSISYVPVTGEGTESKSECIYVSEDIYRLNLNYPEGYKGLIKPGQKISINDIEMSHEYLDEGNKAVKEAVTDFELKVAYENEDGTEEPFYNEDIISVIIKGKSLEITGKDEGRTEIGLVGSTIGKDGETYEAHYAIPIEVSGKEICDEHTWSAWKDVKSATCTEAGLMKRTCEKCGTEETKEIPASHKWGAWAIKSVPTIFAAGVEERTCSVCKKTESRAYGSKLAPTMTLTANSLKMQVKQKTTAFKVTGMASGDYVASVTSGNTKVLKVSGVNGNGTFKLSAQKKAGSAKLTIRLASGLTKVVKVTVQKKAVKTSKISGLNKKLALKKGASAKLAPVIAPVTSKDKVKYKTSNKKVVTVTSKGVIKAKKAGKAKITVKSGSKKFTVTVTVK